MNVPKGWFTAAALAFKRFGQIDGEQRAAAFAYYVFFSVFPLLLLFVTIGSLFLDRERVMREVIDFTNTYLPLGRERQNVVLRTVQGVLESRGEVGIVAFCVLLWSALKFLKVMIRAVNRAWSAEVYNWWRLPLKSLTLLGIVASAFVLGIAAPAVAGLLRGLLKNIFGALTWTVDVMLLLIPVLVLFYGLSMVYRLAPSRPTRFSEVWLPALAATILFRGVETMFVLYVRHFADFNALYGTLGGIIAFLTWIYVSGIVFVLGACFCAARHEAKENSVNPAR